MSDELPPSLYYTDTTRAPVDGPLWEAVERVRAALAASSSLKGFDERQPTHVRVLLQLSPREVCVVAQSSRELATRLANAALGELTAGRFSEALQLYDGAVEGELVAGAAANPLFAVQDDNNHLGVDPARHRRYLERCLPHGEANPTVYLNASFVWMELGEHERALDALERCAARGKDVTSSRHEPLLAPLSDHPRFKRLMEPVRSGG